MSQVIDLTTGQDLDRKLSTLEVLEEEDFSSRIINSSIDGIFAMDAHFRYTIWNPAMEYLTGYSRQEVLGRNAFQLFPFLVEKGMDKRLQEALAGQTIHSEAMTIHFPPKTKPSFCERIYSPLKNDQGQIVGVLCFLRDLTEVKQSYEEIIRLNRELECQVRDRTSELENAVIQLKKEAEERFRAEKALQFVADAGSQLAGSLDYGVTISNILQLATLHFDGWSILSLMDEKGELQPTYSHRDPDKSPLVAAFHGGNRRSPGAPGDSLLQNVPRQVCLTRTSEWTPFFTESMIREMALDEEHRDAIQLLKPKSHLCVPITARNRSLGAISLFTADRFFTSDDLRIAEDLGRHFGLAIDNSRLFAELTSQRSHYRKPLPSAM